MSDELVDSKGKPVSVRLTPGIITLIGLIFGVCLTATIFVIKLDEKVSTALANQREMTAELNNLRREVYAQSYADARQREKLDSLLYETYIDANGNITRRSRDLLGK